VNSLQVEFLILLSQEAKANPQVGKVLVNLSSYDLKLAKSVHFLGANEFPYKMKYSWNLLEKVC